VLYQKPEITGDKVILVFLLLDLLCAAAMILGIVELISERIQKLDRTQIEDNEENRANITVRGVCPLVH